MLQSLTSGYVFYMFAFIVGLAIGGGLDLLWLGVPGIKLQQSHKNRRLLVISVFLFVTGLLLSLTGFIVFLILVISKVNASDGTYIFFAIITLLISLVIISPIFFMRSRKTNKT